MQCSINQWSCDALLVSDSAWCMGGDVNTQCSTANVLMDSPSCDDRVHDIVATRWRAMDAEERMIKRSQIVVADPNEY